MEIESGLPIPKSRRDGFKDEARATFKRMKAGDSILVPQEDAGLWRVHAHLYAKEGRRLGFACDFVTRKVDGGVRIWRTE